MIESFSTPLSFRIHVYFITCSIYFGFAMWWTVLSLDPKTKPGASLLDCLFAYDKEDGLQDDLIGVALTTEVSGADSSETSLGFVIPKSRNISIAAFRNILLSQLISLPPAFTFLTKERWPVSLHQENSLKLRHLIGEDSTVRIQRCFDKPRVGVKTKSGTAIGFVFINHTSSLTSLRQAIIEQLGYIGGTPQTSYQFLDSNGWPISCDQENQMTILDAIVNCTVYLCGEVFHNETVVPVPPPVQALPDDASHIVNNVNNLSVENSKKKSKMPRQLTYRSSKDEDRREVGTSPYKRHEILLSYVRAEAAQTALNLKKALSDLGYSVYLDVHEIKTGIDWQDALNYAVSNCEMFVPLVTTRYGETQWTNREVKLADVLDKFILPVSFLDHWPPRCLAIQFATTQYIRWNVVPSGKEPGNDGQPPEDDPVKMVAQELGDMYRNYCREVRESKVLTNIKTWRKVSNCIKYAWTMTTPPHNANDEENEKETRPPLVVISLHPKDQAIADRLKMLCEKEGYSVWCSTELMYDDELAPTQDAALINQNSQDLFDDIANTQNSRASIISVEEFANDTTQGQRMIFQQKADEAGVVIFMLSLAFADSKTCQQQVFYCEHRKRVIPVKVEEFCMPGWMSMLIGTSILENAKTEGYQESIMQRVKRAMDPTAGESISEELNEAKISRSATLLKKAIPPEGCVYVSGGTKFYYKDTEAICKAIGEHLSAVEGLTLVTGGFFGVGDLVGKAFFEMRQKDQRPPGVWHVLPQRDDKDCRHQARQNRDRTFQIASYGSTVLSGESVRERETIVSRVFDICVLIEGGPGAAHEAEQFSWNDHLVIPVRVTGGAAGGKFNVPDKIFEVPQGVKPEDWGVLANPKATPDQIGQAVAKIILGIQRNLRMYSDGPGTPLRKRKLGMSRAKIKATNSMKTFLLKSP